MLLRAETSVEIDLQEQRAYLLQNGRPVLASPISSGRYGHLTRTGSFTVLDKERSHHSSMYGKIVDASGNTAVADADAESKTPLRFLMPCRSGLPSLCSAGRQSTATTQANRNRVFRGVHVSAHSWVRAFRLRLLQCGGGKSICRVPCLSGGDSAFQMRWGQRTLQLIAASFLPLLTGWCWRWRSWARSKAEQDQPGY